MQAQNDGTGLSIGFGWNGKGEPAVLLMIPRNANIDGDNGPIPGVALPVGRAREIAYALLVSAEQLANGVVKLPEAPPPCPPNARLVVQ
ncbi:MAG: hypothetical protein LLG20_17200 [Acidobacteriales bacterium]|nr:hypothetical protein [Terriglobales bacterium]